jgi:penicillin-binding protein 2
MDVNNGDVIALASTPGFDPNLFNIGLSGDQWRELTTNDHKPLLNKVMGGTYPPGSTFKPAVALAAIDAGIATPDYRVHCNGVFVFGGHEFHCWRKGGHGSLDVEGALQHSCDVFFYETARRVGIDRIEAAARKLGLGAATGIELPGERSGLIPSRAWKQKTYHQSWQQGDTLSVGIGQGYVTATPLQLCQQTARIASGRAVTPRLVHSVGGRVIHRPEAPRLDFSEEALATVRSGMNKVMNDPGGTAYTWRIAQPGMEMAGKTGTAQVRVITAAERASGVKKDASLPWNLRDHGLFIAFAPVAQPRYACACVVEHNAPPHPQVQVARDVLLYAQQRDVLGRRTAYPLNAARAQPPASKDRA